jgi:hypothetical protein
LGNLRCQITGCDQLLRFAIGFAAQFARSKWDGKKTPDAVKAALASGFASEAINMITEIVASEVLRTRVAAVGSVTAVQRRAVPLGRAGARDEQKALQGGKARKEIGDEEPEVRKRVLFRSHRETLAPFGPGEKAGSELTLPGERHAPGLLGSDGRKLDVAPSAEGGI